MLQSKVRRGELDRLITFIKPIIENSDSNADKITGWEEVSQNATVYARKKDWSGREVVVADRLQYVQRTVFTIDWRSDLTTINRLVHGTAIYEILALLDNESGRERYLDVQCNLLDTEQWTDDLRAFSIGFNPGYA